MKQIGRQQDVTIKTKENLSTKPVAQAIIPILINIGKTHLLGVFIKHPLKTNT